MVVGGDAIRSYSDPDCKAKIEKMTTYDYHVVMKPVGIAKLKARLSEYLRAVRGGATLTVLDRNMPVAKIIPIRQSGLRIRKPAPGSPPPKRMPLPPPLDLEFDVLDLLAEERQDR